MGKHGAKMICRTCGYKFLEECGKYGCPNCEAGYERGREPAAQLDSDGEEWTAISTKALKGLQDELSRVKKALRVELNKSAARNNDSGATEHEPTEDMMLAGHIKLFELSDGEDCTLKDIGEVYKAMRNTAGGGNA